MSSVLILALILLLSIQSKEKKSMFYPTLTAYLEMVETQLSNIPESRKPELNKLAGYIQKQLDSSKTAQLTFICTHNSRRSHLSQIWAKVAAEKYGLGELVHTFSGGTEATAFNPRAVAAIERAGLTVKNPGGDNPKYEVLYSDKAEPMICFSKRYDDNVNPQSDFAAIMTCDDADANCPVVLGASARIPIKYVDPKVSDGTEEEAQTYDERCLQIATEMMYVFSQVRVNH
jgi:arsenate reductase